MYEAQCVASQAHCDLEWNLQSEYFLKMDKIPTWLEILHICMKWEFKLNSYWDLVGTLQRLIWKRSILVYQNELTSVLLPNISKTPLLSISSQHLRLWQGRPQCHRSFPYIIISWISLDGGNRRKLVKPKLLSYRLVMHLVIPNASSYHWMIWLLSPDRQAIATWSKCVVASSTVSWWLIVLVNPGRNQSPGSVPPFSINVWTTFPQIEEIIAYRTPSTSTGFWSTWWVMLLLERRSRVWERSSTRRAMLKTESMCWAPFPVECVQQKLVHGSPRINSEVTGLTPSRSCEFSIFLKVIMKTVFPDCRTLCEQTEVSRIPTTWNRNCFSNKFLTDSGFCVQSSMWCKWSFILAH